MKADEADNARVHLLDRDCRVPASESAHPPLGGDRISLQLGGPLNRGQLRILYVIQHRTRGREPILAQCHDVDEGCRCLRDNAPRSAAWMRRATGTITKECRIP